jgi:hypothetical protein
MKQFEETIKEIFHFIAEYGIQNKPLDFRNYDKISENDKHEFLVKVHKGFRLGQDLIIKEIVPLFKEREKLKKAEIESKRNKEKELLKKIINDIHLVEYKIKLLRHFADFIAWQVFKNDYYKARRFYSGSRSRPDLLNSNLQSVLNAVDYFNKQDDINFALVSDLTSFIDIGDILLIGKDSISVIECKEGEVQSKVFDFLDEINKDDFDIRKVDLSNKNAKFFKQAERTIKQIERGSKLSNFLKNEKGLDPFSNVEIKVFEATNPTEYYFDELINLIEKSKLKSYACGEIEEMIFIGIYRGENNRQFSRFFFNEVVKQMYSKHIVVDYLNVIGLPLKEPLFFKPFGVPTIFDILFGRVQIFLAINLDKLIDSFNENGVNARWMSRKETHKIIDSGKGFEPFVYQNQAIEIMMNDQPIILGDSFLIYLLLDNVTPSSYISRYKNIK